MSITLKEAYLKGYRVGSTVDLDVAQERFIRKYCQHPVRANVVCELEHAWLNGFEDQPCGVKHALSCPLGVAHPGGHAECEGR